MSLHERTDECLVDGLNDFVTDNNIEIRVVRGRTYLVLYKAVRLNFLPWYNIFDDSTLTKRMYRLQPYKPGTVVKCRKYSTNRFDDCGPGLHVATWSWACVFRKRHNLRLVQVLVRPKDVVCVPNGVEGKIRCKKLWVTRTCKVKHKPKLGE
jgi:hypothetical protein